MTLLLSAGRAAIDRYLLPAAVGLLLWAQAGTDGRTPYRYANPAPHTTRAVLAIMQDGKKKVD